MSSEIQSTSREEQSSNTMLTALSAINKDEQWVNIEAEVLELWEARNDSIAQVGLIGDSSGSMKFVAWESGDLPELEEGEAYAFKNVVTDEYENRFSVEMNGETTVKAIDAERDQLAANVPHTVSIDTIDSDGNWIDLQAEVVRLWDSSIDSIAQIGLLGAGEETIKFVSWEKSNLPELEENEAYIFENVVTDEHEGGYSVKLNTETRISQIE